MKKNIPFAKIAGLAFLVSAILGGYNLLMMMGGGIHVRYLLNFKGGLPNTVMVCANLLLSLVLLVGRKSKALQFAIFLRAVASILPMATLLYIPVELWFVIGLRMALNVVVWIMSMFVARAVINGKAESVKTLGIITIVVHFFATGMSGVGTGLLNLLGTFASLLSLGMMIIWLLQDALQTQTAAAAPKAAVEEEPEIDDSFYRELLEHGSITQEEYDAWVEEQKAMLKNK